jgi:rRNA maturation endonuclease Nob1
MISKATKQINKIKLKCSNCKERATSFINSKPYCEFCFNNLRRKLKLRRDKND